jgi:hypothetical protein
VTSPSDSTDPDAGPESAPAPTHDPVRYLEAKRTVDARALNAAVWQRFLEALLEKSGPDDEPLSVASLGAGTGATARRLADAFDERGAAADVDYALVDVDGDALDTARERLAKQGKERGYDVFATADRLVWSSDAQAFSFEFVKEDVLAYLDGAVGPFDAVVAQAILDLLHVPTAIDRIDARLHPGGLTYLPLHLDGVTTFRPAVDPDLDARVERLYHESMDRSTPHGPAGGAQTGRLLFDELRRVNHRIVEAGPSDWVVFDREEGGYPADEGYFLRVILGFVESELRGHPEVGEDALDAWLDERREQVRDGRLVYLTHQMDLASRRPG